MTRYYFTVLVFVTLMIFGCNSHCKIHDYELYDTGEVKSEGVAFINGTSCKYSHVSEYFKSGRLKSEQWLRGDCPVVKLEFYENGRLKVEERFLSGELTYGAYYAEDGKINRTSGKRLSSAYRKGLP